MTAVELFFAVIYAGWIAALIAIIGWLLYKGGDAFLDWFLD